MVSETSAQQAAAAAAGSLPAPLGGGDGQADGSSNHAQERFWATPSSTAPQQIKFAVAPLQQMSYEPTKMEVSFAWAKAGEQRPPPHKFTSHQLVRNREGDPYVVGEWIPLARDASARTLVWYRYKIWVKNPVIGAYEYVCLQYRCVLVGAGKRMRFFDLLPSSSMWRFENQGYAPIRVVQGTTLPLSEQLETFIRILLSAPSQPRWLQAAAGFVQARARVDEAPRDLGLQVVVQGLLRRATPRQHAEQQFQRSVLLLAGAGAESLGLEAGTCCGPLLSQVAEETLTALDHEGGPRDLVWRGLRVLAGHNMRHETDYAWLPLLLWGRKEALPTEGGQRGGAAAGMGPDSAEIDSFLARAMDITDRVQASRRLQVVEMLLDCAPSGTAALGLLLHAFEGLPVAPGPRDVALLRHVPLPQLIAGLQQGQQQVPERLRIAVRRAVVGRGGREALDATTFAQAVRGLGLQGEEIKTLLTGMLEDRRTAGDALPAMLAPHVMAQVSHLQAFTRDVVRKWFGRGVDRAMTTGESLAVCVADVLSHGRGLLASAPSHLSTQLDVLRTQLDACALRRLSSLSPREALQSVRPLTAWLAAHEGPEQVQVGALLWGPWLAGALRTWVTPRSPEALLAAVEAMGLGEEELGAHEGLDVRAVDLLAGEVEGHVLTAGGNEAACHARLLECADAAAALFRLRRRAWGAQGLGDGATGAGPRLVQRVRRLLGAFEDGSISLGQLEYITAHCPSFAAQLATYSQALVVRVTSWDPRPEAWFLEAGQTAALLKETLDQLECFLHTFTAGTVRVGRPRGETGQDENKGETCTEAHEQDENEREGAEEEGEEEEEGEGEDGEEDEGPREGDTWEARDVAVYERALGAMLTRRPSLSLTGARALLTSGAEGVREQWGMLWILRTPALQLCPLHASRLLRNAWDLSVSQWILEAQAEERLTVAVLARDVPPVARTRLSDFLAHCRAPPPSLTVACVAEMLLGLEAEGLEAELTSLHSHCNVTGAHGCLDAFLRLPVLCAYASAVLGLGAVLDSSDSAPLLAASALLKNLGETDRWAHTQMSELLGAVAEFKGLLVGVWDAMPLLGELGNCGTLLSLVRRMLQENTLFLINAVEEHGEAALRADTVSSFDDIRQLLGPVLRGEVERGPGECGLLAGLRSLRERALMQGGGGDAQACLHGMAARARMCALHANALKDMYENVANREELTKATVARLLQSGSFRFTITPSEPSAQISLSATCVGADGDEQTFVQARLEDLRGRALLQVNHTTTLTPQQQQQQQQEQQAQRSQDRERLRRFIDATQHGTARQLSALSELGHLDYRTYAADVRVCPDAMAAAEATVRAHHEAWATQLRALRSQHHYVNYVGCPQLGGVADFLAGAHPTNADETREALEVLRFVCPRGMDEGRALEWHGQVPACSAGVPAVERLAALAAALDEAVDSWALGPGNGGDVPAEGHVRRLAKKGGGEVVLPREGGLLVATYDGERDLHACVLRLFQSTSTAGDGKASRRRLLLCCATTRLSELDMFVQRALGGGRAVHGTFVLLHAHTLPHDCRAHLAKTALSARRTRPDGSTALLTLLLPSTAHECIGQWQQGGVEVHALAPLPLDALKGLVATQGGAVHVVSATAAGMGKTTHIRTLARQQLQGSLHTLGIGDGDTRACLAPRLRSLLRQAGPMEEGGGLHIDVGTLEHHGEVNTALFELLMLRCLQVGRHVVHLPATMPVYVEVAHALQLPPLGGTLRAALPVLDAFSETRLEGGVAQLCFDHSGHDGDVQVVCNYLRLLDTQQLATTVLHFHGPERNAPVLGRDECAALLQGHFFDNVAGRGGASFSVLRVFLAVLADQLRKFGASPHMHPENLDDADVRGAIVASLVQVSRDLATRCVEPARQRQQGVDNGLAPGLDVGLLRWEDSTHTFMLFQPQDGCLSVLCRNPTLLPPALKDTLQALQCAAPLQDLSEEQLRTQLGMLCGRRDNGENMGSPDYVLTPDNLLKMCMILVRVSARVPVLLMGETGCGKTSLVQFLSAAAGACLQVFNVHAGRSAADIAEFVARCEALAEQSGQPVWAFLDEINTCAQLSLLSDVMVHHSLYGRALHPQVTFLAAVNPYRLKPPQSLSVGLDAAQKRSIPDLLSLLVYRVHRLPQSMIDFLWDFGALTPGDEAGYIRTLMHHAPGNCGKALAELVVCCHAFVRDREDRSAVSMRDVRRCKLLVDWFYAHRLRVLQKLQADALAEQRGLLNRLGRGVRSLLPGRGRGWVREWDVETQAACEAMILGVALCYRSRLPLPELRRQMGAKLATVLSRHAAFKEMDAEAIRTVIVTQQRQWAERMDLGPGIALNEALLENIFVLLVCILLKLPVFLVGKPGSSKTLAMKRIEATLCGRDAADPLWRAFGEVKVVSYQGSESSTSEGVLQAFEKAQSYAQASNSNANVVVLLDEVGLPELSPSNPLKVLHAKLELHDLDRPATATATPEGEAQEAPKGEQRLAVVGMSNWCLDASKMNRALHIARPEPDAADLLVTAKAIFQSLGARLSGDVTRRLQGLADAYLAYCEGLRSTRHAHFHGLRDWYWAVKLLARGVRDHGRLRPEDLARAVARNFSGLDPSHPSSLRNYVDAAATVYGGASPSPLLMGPTAAVCGPREAVVANLRDADCRHLLLLSPNGEAMLGLIPRLFAEAGRPPPCVLLGSRLPGDQCESYSYRILSQIIQCLETGRCVVLKDLSQLYGSLYDCLNMAYTTVAGRNHCRVALGAYSNPLCHVEDGVRIVVLVDQEAAPSMDPPFLSRFEKQRLSFHALLDPAQRSLADRLGAWAESMATPGFALTDTFTGLGPSSIDALLAVCPELTSLEEGKARLLRLASCDGMVRAVQALQADGEAYCLQYLEDGGHANLPAYLRTYVAPQAAKVFKAVVTTFTCLSLFQADAAQLVAAAGLGEGRVWAHRLGSVDSEAALADLVQGFFKEAGDGLLLLECDAELHRDHMLLARFLVDREAATHEAGFEEVKENDGEMQQARKVVIFLTQVTRGPTAQWEACVSHQWDVYHIDDLLLSDEQYRELAAFRHTATLREVLAREGVFEAVLQPQLLACLCSLRYPRGLSDPEVQVAARMLNIVEALERDQGGLWSLMNEKVLPLVQADAADAGPPGAHWLVGVARDLELLSLSGFSLANAVRQQLAKVVHRQVTRLLHGLEQASALDTFLQLNAPDQSPIVAAFARAALLSDAFLPLKPIAQAPSLLPLDVVVLGLRFPFSRCLYNALAPVRALHADAAVDEDDAPGDARGHCSARISAILRALLSGLTPDPVRLWSEGGLLLRDIVTLTVASDGGGAVSRPLLALALALVNSGQAGGELAGKLLLLWDRLPQLRHVAALLASTGTDPEVAAQGLQAHGDLDAWALDHCATAAAALVHRCVATLAQEADNGRGVAWHAEVEEIQQRVVAVMGPQAPSPTLLALLCLLKVLQDLAPLLATLPAETQLPFTTAQGLGMDEATLDTLQTWLASLPPPLEAESTKVQAALLDRFLYVAIEDAYDSGAVALAHPLLHSVCGHMCRMAQDPPVCLTLVLEALMEEVKNVLADANSSPRHVVCENRLPPALQPAVGPLEAVLSQMKGSPLEVMLLDVLDGRLSDDTWATGEGHVADDLVFDRALANAIGEAEGRPLGFFARLYSHAYLRRCQRQVAEPLGRGQPSPEALRHAVDRGLGQVGTTDASVGLLHTLRLYFLKSLHLDVASLRAAILDPTTAAASGWRAPWMLALDWQTPERATVRLGFNPFLSDAYREAADAWDALHSGVPPNPVPMAILMDRALADIAEPPQGGEGTAAAAALIQAGFMRVHNRGHSHVDPRGEEQLARLAAQQGVAGRMGRLGLACLQPLPGLQGQEDAMATLLHSLGVRLMAEAARRPAHVLSGYVLAPPEELRRWMVLGAQSDELGSVLAALPEAVTRYVCACGHPYVVGNCGNVNQAGTCPNCHRTLGGHQYNVPAEGQQRLDATPTTHAPAEDKEVAGYLFSPHCVDPEVDHSERRLSPTQHRLLTLLVHAALLASSLSGEGEEGLWSALTSTPGAGPLAGPTVAQHCLTVMHSCVTRLRRRVLPQGARLDLLAAWLHDLLGALFADPTLAAAGPCTTPAQRRACEEAFAGVCNPRLEDVVGRAGQALERYAEVEVPLLEKELAELRPPPTTAYCQHAYRLTCPPSRETLHAAFSRHAGTREAYPLVDAFLRHADRLTRLRHLLPIVEWTNAVRRARGRQLSREQARTLSHVSLWQGGQEESKAADMDTEEAGVERLTREAFERFQGAWNGVRETAVCRCCDQVHRVRFECKCFELWPMDPSLPLLSSCISVQAGEEEIEGRAAAAILGELATVQNDFLRECADGNGFTVPVQRAKADVLVQVDGLWEGLQRYGRCRLGFGAGHEVEYDWDKVTRHVAQACVDGKALLSVDDLEAFAFAGEAFSATKTLLAQVDERVGQQALPDKDALAREARLRDGHEVSSRGLPLLQSLMHMLVTVSAPLNPHMTLADFANAWLDQAGRSSMASCPLVLRELWLCHVEGLYEHLEDVIAESILPHIPAAYAQPLPPLVQEDLGALVAYAGGLAAFESAWRRFIIRHLRRPHPLPVDGSLAAYAPLVRWAHRGDVSDQAELAPLCEALKLGMAVSVLAEVRRRRREEEQQREQRSVRPVASGSGITDRPPSVQTQAVRPAEARQPGQARGGAAQRRNRGLNV